MQRAANTVRSYSYRVESQSKPARATAILKLPGLRKIAQGQFFDCVVDLLPNLNDRFRLFNDMQNNFYARQDLIFASRKFAKMMIAVISQAENFGKREHILNFYNKWKMVIRNFA